MAELRSCTRKLSHMQEILQTVPVCGSIMRVRGVAFARLYNDLLTAYAITILYYLELKRNGISLRNHPVINKLL